MLQQTKMFNKYSYSVSRKKQNDEVILHEEDELSSLINNKNTSPFLLEIKHKN